jgi:hypothetical protein
MKRILLFVLGGLFALCLAAVVAPYLLISSIRESHVNANVSDGAQFSAILSTGLRRYFSNKFAGEIDVRYQMLRNQPTQAGVAFPKFYAWVTVASLPSGAKMAEGAVRLSAENKSSISVTDFVPAHDIKGHSDDLKRIFPSDVIDKIKEHPSEGR